MMIIKEFQLIIEHSALLVLDFLKVIVVVSCGTINQNEARMINSDSNVHFSGVVASCIC